MIKNIGSLDLTDYGVMKTGFGFFDHVVGGLPYNRITIFHGSPGFGKSTLARQLAVNADKQGLWTLYVSAEEEAEVQGLWYKRHSIQTQEHIDFFEKGEAEGVYIEDIMEACEKGKYRLLVIDSIQKIKIKNGSISKDTSLQALLELYQFKRKNPNLAIFVIAQETKGGNMAGSNKILHEADILMEGIQENGQKYIRYEKNREGMVGDKFKIFTIDGLLSESVATGEPIHVSIQCSQTNVPKKPTKYIRFSSPEKKVANWGIPYLEEIKKICLVVAGIFFVLSALVLI